MTQTTDLIEIRPAAQGDAYACRMLLPAAFGPQEAPDRLLVAAGSDGIVLGAAAVAWRIARDAPGFPVLVTVAPPLRRQGLGRRLIDAVAADAAGETTALRAWTPLPPESDAAAFLRRCGFEEAVRFMTFEAAGDGVAAFGSAMNHNIQRLLARGRIPAGVEVVPGDVAPAAAIALLAAREFPGITLEAVRRMEQGDFGVFDPVLSVAVLHGGRVVAASLCRGGDASLHVDMTMVDQHYRNGWANLLMLQAIAERCGTRGFSACRFTCDSRVQNTMRLVPRSGARCVGETVMLARVF